MVGFVDDSNGQTNDFMHNETPTTTTKILQKLHHNAQALSDILGVSGGALEIPKCSSHFLTWTFGLQGDPVLIKNRQATEQPIDVTDPLTKKAHSMTILSPYEAHKTLGHFKEPAGSQLTQYTKLRQKSDKSTDFIWKCHLTRREAWTYYCACYLPSIGYPLACSSLTYNQLDCVQRKAMQIIVARCGYNRHDTKREILYGPMSYGGANFRHLYMHQGVGQITTFMRHWRQPLTIPGRLLWCAVAWTQLTAGTSYSIFWQVYDPLPHLESKWLQSMRIFMLEINANMELDFTGVPPIQRQHDTHIMDMILESQKFSPAQIRRLNYCRLYLQAVTISDSTDTTGTQLDAAKLAGTPSVKCSTTTWLHVNQDRPSEDKWKLWKRANKLWSSQTGMLYAPIGAWLHNGRCQRQQHFAYLRKRQLYVCVCSTQYQVCVPTQLPGEFRLYPRICNSRSSSTTMQYRSRLSPLPMTRTIGKSTPPTIATTTSTLLTGQKHSILLSTR